MDYWNSLERASWAHPDARYAFSHPYLFVGSGTTPCCYSKYIDIKPYNGSHVSRAFIGNGCRQCLWKHLSGVN